MKDILLIIITLVRSVSHKVKPNYINVMLSFVCNKVWYFLNLHDLLFIFGRWSATGLYGSLLTYVYYENLLRITWTYSRTLEGVVAEGGWMWPALFHAVEQGVSVLVSYVSLCALSYMLRAWRCMPLRYSVLCASARGTHLFSIIYCYRGHMSVSSWSQLPTRTI